MSAQEALHHIEAAEQNVTGAAAQNAEVVGALNEYVDASNSATEADVAADVATDAVRSTMGKMLLRLDDLRSHVADLAANCGIVSGARADTMRHCQTMSDAAGTMKDSSIACAGSVDAASGNTANAAACLPEDSDARTRMTGNSVFLRGLHDEASRTAGFAARIAETDQLGAATQEGQSFKENVEGKIPGVATAISVLRGLIAQMAISAGGHGYSRDCVMVFPGGGRLGDMETADAVALLTEPTVLLTDGLKISARQLLETKNNL